MARPWSFGASRPTLYLRNAPSTSTNSIHQSARIDRKKAIMIADKFSLVNSFVVYIILMFIIFLCCNWRDRFHWLSSSWCMLTIGVRHRTFLNIFFSCILAGLGALLWPLQPVQQPRHHHAATLVRSWGYTTVIALSAFGVGVSVVVVAAVAVAVAVA